MHRLDDQQRRIRDRLQRRSRSTRRSRFRAASANSSPQLVPGGRRQHAVENPSDGPRRAGRDRRTRRRSHGHVRTRRSGHRSNCENLGTDSPAIDLPLKVKLDNPALGERMLHRLQLRTDRAAADDGHDQSAGAEQTDHGRQRLGRIVSITQGSSRHRRLAGRQLVRAPGVNGCGGLLATVIDPVVNVDAGLPAAAGKNTARPQQRLRDDHAAGDQGPGRAAGDRPLREARSRKRRQRKSLPRPLRSDGLRRRKPAAAGQPPRQVRMAAGAPARTARSPDPRAKTTLQTVGGDDDHMLALVRQPASTPARKRRRRRSR